MRKKHVPDGSRTIWKSLSSGSLPALPHHPGKRLGHAGAINSGGKGTAQEKLAVMEKCGIKVTGNPAEMGQVLKSIL